MKKNPQFSLQDRIKSFKHAFNGLRQLLKREHNSRIHLIAAILSLSIGYFLKISSLEWIALISVIALVFICELINSALEEICDFIEPKQNSKIGLIKDYAAAAVLVTSALAIIVGVLLFIPKLF